MIIQAGPVDFPKYIDKVFFVLGMLLFTVGQGLLQLGREFVSNQSPVDFAHWLLLVGVVFLLPFTGRLPRREIHLITIPLMLVAITAIIGMNALDFIFWSLPAGEFKDQVVAHLMSTPSIWQPFIAIGPGYPFNIGLLLITSSYFSAARWGTFAVIAGTVTVYLGGGGSTWWATPLSRWASS